MRPFTPLQDNRDHSEPPDHGLRSLRNPALPLDNSTDTDNRPLPIRGKRAIIVNVFENGLTSGGLLASVLQAGLDQAGEEGVRLGGPGLELRVGLGAHIEGVLVLGELHELGQLPVRAGARDV